MFHQSTMTCGVDAIRSETALRFGDVIECLTRMPAAGAICSVLEALVNALPDDLSEHGRIRNWLQSSANLLDAGEFNAAIYQLRLLQRSIARGPKATSKGRRRRTASRAA